MEQIAFGIWASEIMLIFLLINSDSDEMVLLLSAVTLK